MQKPHLTATQGRVCDYPDCQSTEDVRLIEPRRGGYGAYGKPVFWCQNHRKMSRGKFRFSTDDVVQVEVNLRTCRACRKPYEALPSQITNHNFLCRTCRNEASKRRRAKKAKQ